MELSTLGEGTCSNLAGSGGHNNCFMCPRRALLPRLNGSCLELNIFPFVEKFCHYVLAVKKED